ncbi:hypothetical protein NFI96_012155 [Prochilodus magdalenae]|nr:hypothetical protein NFI96_012155 [Prochilodus magdalenae]
MWPGDEHRLKTPLIFTLYLISGPVGCFDVLGHTGGSIMIYCEHKEYGLLDKYFCRRTSTADECVYLQWNGTQSGWVQKGRYSLSGSSDGLMVIVSQLSLQDTGLYQCGETGVWSHDVKLTVNTDPCCSGPKTVAGYLGETVTISCPYPEEFETNIKLLFKLKGQYYSEVIRTTDFGDSRFSISEDRSSGMFSVRISDVGEDDGGVYYCTVGKGGRLVSYFSFFTEIRLQVTGLQFEVSRGLRRAMGISEAEAPFRMKILFICALYLISGSSAIIIIISVSVCVVLLLIGGSALIFYRLRCTKKQGSAVFNQQSKSTRTADGDYENDPHGKQCSIRMGPVYQNMGPNTIQSNSVYRSLDSKTREPNSVYHTLNPNNNQSGDPNYTVVSTNLKKSLKEEYDRILDGNSLTGHKKSLRKVYTDLYIVENGTGGVIQGHEVRQMEASSSRPFEEEAINCNDLFKIKDDGTRNRKVLTMGIAGVGKTVSVNKFILDWAEGQEKQDMDWAERQENQDIVFIFPLPFRYLNLIKDREVSLMELLQDFFPDCIGLDSLPTGDSKVLFIFDGLDECRFPLNFSTREPPKNVRVKASVGLIIANLLNKNLLPSALVWVTSRPAATHLIPRDYFDQVTEVRGFNEKQKEEYFERYCGKDLANTIMTHLRKFRSLYIMCHIPVFCWISATVLSGTNPKTPTTLTGMYIRFLVQQANLMKTKYTGSPKDIILKLGELAFGQLENENLVFYKKDLEACGIDISGGLVYSGMCTQIFKMEDRSSERMVYSFVHLSIQEALAAVHVFYSHRVNKKSPFIQTLKAGLKWWFKHSSYELHKAAVQRALQSENGHLDLFLRFLLGLSAKACEINLEELLPGMRTTSGSMEKTVNYIKKKIKMSETSERSFNLFHCLSELGDNSLVSEVQSFLKSGDLSVKDLSSTQWSTLVFVLLMSDETQEMFELNKYRESDEGLRKLLPVVKSTKNGVLNCCQLTEASCGLLASVLSSNSSYLIELDLSDNDLQDSGVVLLSEGLKSSQCKLKTLKLSGCMITEEGCSSLASALGSNPSHLRELDLSYNHPGESGVRQLNERLNDTNFKLEILNTDHGGEERLKPGLQKYACKLTLDPDTAHTDLSVCNDNRTVKWVKEKTPSPDHPERFDTWCQVLSREGLSGRCYWEVEWNEGGVHIGLAYKGISRKGRGNECWFGQNDTSWSLDCARKNYTARHRGSKTIISAADRCSYRIGVYLDWPAGRLSFYNVSSDTQKQRLSHLHTFLATFTEPLYTGFMVIDSTVTLCTTYSHNIKPTSLYLHLLSGLLQWSGPPQDTHRTTTEQLEHPHTVPADGAVGVAVEGHQAFWTCDNRPFILVLTMVPPHTDSLGVSTKTKAGLVTEDDPLPF